MSPISALGRAAVVLFLVLHVPDNARAANVIDQNQPDGPLNMGSFYQTDLAQSFQQSATNISGAGIYLSAEVLGSGTITIALWSGLPTDAGSTLLASASASGTSDGWVDVFWAPVAVTPGTTMFLVFTSSNDALGITGSTADPYPYGNAYANPGYASFPDYDYTFRTYYDDTFSGGGCTTTAMEASLVAAPGSGATLRKGRVEVDADQRVEAMIQWSNLPSSKDLLLVYTPTVGDPIVFSDYAAHQKRRVYRFELTDTAFCDPLGTFSVVDASDTSIVYYVQGAPREEVLPQLRGFLRR